MEGNLSDSLLASEVCVFFRDLDRWGKFGTSKKTEQNCSCSLCSFIVLLVDLMNDLFSSLQREGMAESHGSKIYQVGSSRR